MLKEHLLNKNIILFVLALSILLINFISGCGQDYQNRTEISSQSSAVVYQSHHCEELENECNKGETCQVIEYCGSQESADCTLIPTCILEKEIKPCNDTDCLLSHTCQSNKNYNWFGSMLKCK